MPDASRKAKNGGLRLGRVALGKESASYRHDAWAKYDVRLKSGGRQGSDGQLCYSESADNRLITDGST